MALIRMLDVSHLTVLLFFVGLYGALTQRNIIKTVISVGVMDIAAISFFMLANYPDDGKPPIAGTPVEMMADPVPQALMITAIVIGVSVTAMCLAMAMRVAYRYDTSDWDILIWRNR